MEQAHDDAYLGIGQVVLPVSDLEIAERFYVEILGATVVGGATPARADHLSVCFGSDTRLDLVCRPNGRAQDDTPHPRIAIRVRPEALMDLARHLWHRDIPVQGPNRLGPPGAAAVYFNDPFGNHLMLETAGYDGAAISDPPDRDALAYRWPAPR